MSAPGTGTGTRTGTRTDNKSFHRIRQLVRLFLLLAGFGASTLCTDAASATSTPVPRIDEKNWRKLATPNFVLYSNAKEADGRQLLVELETFRHVVSRFLGLTNVQREPALVYLFSDDRGFTDFKPRYEGRPRAVSGFHVADPLGTALALSRQARNESTLRVMFHEYTHLLTARQFRDAPLWAHEGVAEVFSTFEAVGDQFDIGVAVTNHVRYLQKEPPAPIGRLLGIDHDTPDYNEKERAGKFYATSWLLAHHLLFARRGFETNIMARYAALSSTTTNQLDAFTQAFGASPGLIDLSLRQYLMGGKYTIVRQTYPDLADARPVPARLQAGELDYALGRLLLLTQQREAAVALFERAMQHAPADPHPHEALALLAWRDHDVPRIRSHADRAITLGSREAFLYFLAAQARYQAALPQGPVPAQEAPEFEAGRRLCERAVTMDPWLAAAHHLLGIYTLARNPRAPGLALVHVREALRCDPRYQPAQITLIALLTMEREFVTARRMLARLLAGPLPADLRESAKQLGERINQLDPTPARSPVPGSRR